jgi:hypothetical protein
MKTVTFYNNLGKVMATVSSSDPNAEFEWLDYNCVEGKISDDHYIENGQAVYKGIDPSTDLIKFVFDYTNKSWQIDLETTGEKHRAFRNEMLKSIDAVSPVRYNSLTESQQQELAVYRLALLAVPQQPGFPTDTSWPPKPQWL